MMMLGKAQRLMRLWERCTREKTREQAKRFAASTNLNNDATFAQEQTNFKIATSVCLAARGYNAT